MNHRRVLAVSLAAVAAALGLVLVALLFVTMVEPNRLRAPLSRFIGGRMGRPIRIDGGLRLHLLARHPQLIAERVTIGNPWWMAPGETARIARLTIDFNLPTPFSLVALHALSAEGASFQLRRTAAGNSNWQLRPPGREDGEGPPTIRRLQMTGAQVRLEDTPRHLKFAGTVTIGDAPEGGGRAARLRITAAGDLNGKTAAIAIDGDPLETIVRGRPYRFAFDERSSGSRVRGNGSLERPFDFRALDTTFRAEGGDLKDLYFLVGLSFPDTGQYRLAGTIRRRGPILKIEGLSGESGQSDVHGVLMIDSTSSRSKFSGALESQHLRLTDFGAKAAGRVAPDQAGSQLLLPSAELPIEGLRQQDGAIQYEARKLEIGIIAFSSVKTAIMLQGGVLEAAPLSAILAQGAVSGTIRFDAAAKRPNAHASLRFADVKLQELHPQPGTDSPFDGGMHGRIDLTGHGRSLHELAATSRGTVTVVVPHGEMRESIAELTGIDLRGVGLKLADNKQTTPIRCAVASFDADNGILNARTLLIDTDPVLINGSGSIHLDTEEYELSFRGHPKSIRLGRLRAPVTMAGRLAHPTFGVKASGSTAQMGAAVALGVVLTPLASVLAFVDPGLAKDADCGALTATAR